MHKEKDEWLHWEQAANLPWRPFDFDSVSKKIVWSTNAEYHHLSLFTPLDFKPYWTKIKKLLSVCCFLLIFLWPLVVRDTPQSSNPCWDFMTSLSEQNTCYFKQRFLQSWSLLQILPNLKKGDTFRPAPSLQWHRFIIIVMKDIIKVGS